MGWAGQLLLACLALNMGDGLKDLPYKSSRDGLASLAVPHRNGKLHGVGLVALRSDSRHASPSHETEVNKEKIMRGLPWSYGPHISLANRRFRARIT